MTNYYLNSSVTNPRLAELLRFMPGENKSGVRLRYIRNMAEAFNISNLAWPILPDDTHPV